MGSVCVPLSTVLCNTEKLDYNFKLHRPVALPAYRVLDDEIYFMTKDKLEEERLRENEQLSTYLNVSISLDPVIELPTLNQESFNGGFEDPNLLINANELLLKLKRKVKAKRDFVIFGDNLKG